MKKILLFLGVFGIGLSILLYVESRQKSKAPPREDVPEDSPPEPAEPEGNEPTDQEGDKPELLRPDGIFLWEKIDSDDRSLLLQLRSKDSRSRAGGRIELVDVELDLYDDETSELNSHLEARTGVVRIAEGAGGLLNPELEQTIELTDVVLELYRGVPLPPLVLTTATLTGDIERGVFDTEDLAAFDARGFSGSGLGMHASLDNGTIVLHAAGRAKLTLEDSSQLEISCSGPLRVEREALDLEQSRLRLQAREDATLRKWDPDGTQVSSLSAAALELFGRAENEKVEDAPFGLESLEARRDVVFVAPLGEFQANFARFFTGPNGDLESGQLQGYPRAKVQIAPVPDGEAELLAGPLEFIGSSTIDFVFGDQLELYAPGPVEAVWGKSRLYALGGMRGTGAPEGGSGRLEAWFEVLLTHEDGLLATPKLVADFEAPTKNPETGVEKPERVLAQASPPALVEGQTDDGREFQVEANESLAFSLVGDDWSVPNAGRVRMSLLGTEGFTATAAEVIDFDPTSLSFVAKGNVDIEGNFDGEAFHTRGEHLDSIGGGDFVLQGVGEAPASFDGEFGRGTAQRVERRGGSLFAIGDVSGTFDDGQLTYEIDCDSFEGQRFTEPGLGAESSLHTVILAKGHVEGLVQWPERSLDIDCAALNLVRIEWNSPTEPGVVSRSEGHLVANEVRRAEVRLTESELPSTWILEADKLTAHRSEATDGTLSQEEVLAAGSVVVRQESEGREPLTGRGDRLDILGTGRGKLYRASDRKVSASGFLPGSSEPFELTADRIEFDARTVLASSPRIVVTRLREELDLFGQKILVEDPIVATARELIGNESSLTLTGRVHLEGEVSRGRPWRLDASKARIYSRDLNRVTVEGEDGAAPEADERAGFVEAWDGFYFKIGLGVEGWGDSLNADTKNGLLRLRGAPAILVLPQNQMRSTEIDFDTVRNAWVNAGPGRAIFGQGEQKQ